MSRVRIYYSGGLTSAASKFGEKLLFRLCGLLVLIIILAR